MKDDKGCAMVACMIVVLIVAFLESCIGSKPVNAAEPSVLENTYGDTFRSKLRLTVLVRNAVGRMTESLPAVGKLLKV